MSSPDTTLAARQADGGAAARRAAAGAVVDVAAVQARIPARAAPDADGVHPLAARRAARRADRACG